MRPVSVKKPARGRRRPWRSGFPARHGYRSARGYSTNIYYSRNVHYNAYESYSSWSSYCNYQQHYFQGRADFDTELIKVYDCTIDNIQGHRSKLQIRAQQERRGKERKKRKKEPRDIYIKKEEELKIEEEELLRRRQGLSCPIASDNKGFVMLQSMGYTRGRGLGKSEQGRKLPLGFTFKIDRSGIGEEADRARRVQDRLKKGIQDFINEKVDVTNYKTRIREKTIPNSATEDLEASQRACRFLDEKKGIEEPQKPWYWPDEEREQQGSEERLSHQQSLPSGNNNATHDVGMKLRFLTKYLREAHYYCVWCGTEYNEEEELKEHCPGPTRGRHKLIPLDCHGKNANMECL